MARSICLTGNSDMILIATGNAATLLLHSTESLTAIKFYSYGLSFSRAWKVLHLLTLCQLINWVLVMLWVKSWSRQEEGELCQWSNSKFMIEFPYFYFIYDSQCDWVSGWFTKKNILPNCPPIYEYARYISHIEKKRNNVPWTWRLYDIVQCTVDKPLATFCRKYVLCYLFFKSMKTEPRPGTARAAAFIWAWVRPGEHTG